MLASLAGGGSEGIGFEVLASLAGGGSEGIAFEVSASPAGGNMGSSCTAGGSIS